MEMTFKEVPNKEVPTEDKMSNIFSFFQKEKLEPVNDDRSLEELLEINLSNYKTDINPEIEEVEGISEDDLKYGLGALDSIDIEVEGSERKELEDINVEDKVYDVIDNLSKEQLKEISEKYPKVYNKLIGAEKSILNDLQSIKDNPEKAEEILKNVENKIGRFKGDLMEAILKEGLDDFFDNILEKEQQVDVREGKNTNIDITCENAKQDFKLGYVEVKEGENLYIESKIGTSAYISGQMKSMENGVEKAHMLDQATGHHTAGVESGREYKSVIVVSKDYLEIYEGKREEFEEKLNEMGTELVILDKSASEIEDKARDAIGGLS